MEIIVPAAGLSSRFPGMKPKYLLYDYKHKMMLQRALADYDYEDCNITIGVLKEHDEKYYAYEFLKHEFGDSVNIVALDKVTNGPADTVYQILQKSNIDNGQEFLIKDCDSFFNHDITQGNYVCVSDISEHEVLNKLASKSFIISNEQGIITNIIEKKVVSNKFCVGGYKFNSVGEYKNAFEKISTEKEIFVSDVISVMLQNGVVFTEKLVTEYTDVGTSQEWFKYNDRPVIFCDIDGTIVKSQSRVGVNTYDDVPIPLENNVKRLLQLQEQGAQFIFTTARKNQYFLQTDTMLHDLGFENFTLIMDLQNAKRILINDFNVANPFPRAQAINIERNSDTLDFYL
jgi:hypothetical protein